MIKFTTKSGSRYEFVDGKLTRLNEKPVIGVNGDNDTTPMVAIEAELIHPLAIGARALFKTERGPLLTSLVITLEET